MSTLTHDLLAKLRALPTPPVAIEALWDGDTQGWFVDLCAVLVLEGCHESRWLHTFSDGGDLRVFQGVVPPWPEAIEAAKNGAQLAAILGIPFYFPSPEHPEDECPHWWQRAEPTPCRRCAVPLLPAHGYAREPDLCSQCKLALEREAREAQWTPAQRQGPRCDICGAPAPGEHGPVRLCEGCLTRYRTFACEGCGTQVTQLRTLGTGLLCGSCVLRQRIARLPPDVQERLRKATGLGLIAAIQEVRTALGCGLAEAQEWLAALGYDARRGGS